MNIFDRHPWLCVPLVLLAFVVPSLIDGCVMMVLR